MGVGVRGVSLEGFHADGMFLGQFFIQLQVEICEGVLQLLLLASEDRLHEVVEVLT